MRYKEIEPRRMADRVDDKVDAEIAVRTLFDNATDNQVVIMQGLLMGMEAQEVARKLGVSPQAVAISVSRLKSRFSKYPFYLV